VIAPDVWVVKMTDLFDDQNKRSLSTMWRHLRHLENEIEQLRSRLREEGRIQKLEDLVYRLEKEIHKLKEGKGK